ncbi:MAG: superoxide dismutase [Bdellovibrionaceae bacterium]|nr:superoxide dismutase [Pseudobdellovibrionaceae bacterium]
MFKLPVIDFSNNSFLTEETVKYHYGKHHAAYIENLNKLISDSEKKTLIEIIKSSRGALFNNAAQAFNHTFYWLCLTPQRSPILPNCDLHKLIVREFGSLEKLRSAFIERALSVFGSGWTWLALNKSTNKLEIINTTNADVVDLENYMPLLVCDVWEHAYYIDYRNSRAKYLDEFWNEINWQFASENYESKDICRIEMFMTAN